MAWFTITVSFKTVTRDVAEQFSNVTKSSGTPRDANLGKIMVGIWDVVSFSSPQFNNFPKNRFRLIGDRVVSVDGVWSLRSQCFTRIFSKFPWVEVINDDLTDQKCWNNSTRWQMSVNEWRIWSDEKNIESDLKYFDSWNLKIGLRVIN